jgi:hypothetical protein
LFWWHVTGITTEMHYLSTVQILVIWDQLTECLYDDNSYGGDTAEIYFYTILPNNPSIDTLRRDENYTGFMADAAKEAVRCANASYVAVLKHFEKVHNAKVTVTDGGVPEGLDWIVDYGTWHRMHVKVTPN